MSMPSATYFLDAASCPHCKAEIYEDESSEKGKDFDISVEGRNNG